MWWPVGCSRTPGSSNQPAAQGDATSKRAVSARKKQGSTTTGHALTKTARQGIPGSDESDTRLAQSAVNYSDDGPRNSFCVAPGDTSTRLAKGLPVPNGRTVSVCLPAG